MQMCSSVRRPYDKLKWYWVPGQSNPQWKAKPMLEVQRWSREIFISLCYLTDSQSLCYLTDRIFVFYILALDYGLVLCPGHPGRCCDSYKIESMLCWTPLIGTVWGTPLHTSSRSYRNPGREAFHQTVNFTHLLWPRKQMVQKLH